jgi:tetratricopeptide (TPR) repeat protein
MAVFQTGLWRASRAGAERDIAASLLADAARSRSPQERAELVHKARLCYEAAVSANPLDETLWAEYGDLLVSLLVVPDGGQAGPGGADSSQPRIRIETSDDVRLFVRAVDAYERAGALSRRWAAPHVHLGRLYQAAAAPDAGSRAMEALAPIVEACAAQRGRPGPNLRYLPALAAFEEALRRDPNNPSPMLLVGEAFEKLGNTEAARAFGERALSIHKLLDAAHPGHKLCLTPDQAARARRLAELPPIKDENPQP